MFIGMFRLFFNLFSTCMLKGVMLKNDNNWHVSDNPRYINECNFTAGKAEAT